MWKRFLRDWRHCQRLEDIDQAWRQRPAGKLSSFAKKTFKMCGILGLFGVYQSEAEAISACSG
jgi:hypothetical protein